MSNRTSSLQDVLKDSFNYETSQMHTAIPAVIVSVDNLAEQRVTVQPTINMRDDTLSINTKRPPIVNVPLQMPITSKGGVSLPISPGDSVMLVFSMRGMTTWKNSNGEFSPPPDMRKFDIKDCIAIPGVYPFKKSPNRRGGYSATDVMIVNGIGGDNESTISVSPNGNVEVDAPGSIELKNGDSRMSMSGGSMKISTQGSKGRKFLLNWSDKGEGYSTGFAFDSLNNSNDNYRLVISKSAATNGNVFTDFRRAGTTIGSIRVASSSSVSYNTSSDYRLKENIEDINDPISVVKRLHPISHTWKNDDSGIKYHGFIAHELQEEIPTAVTGAKDEVDDEGNPVYQGVDYSKAVPLLTAALQKAIERIEVLEQEIVELKGNM